MDVPYTELKRISQSLSYSSDVDIEDAVQNGILAFLEERYDNLRTAVVRETFALRDKERRYGQIINLYIAGKPYLNRAAPPSKWAWKFYREVVRCLKRIPPTQARTVRLRLKGLSIKEIADRLNVRPATVTGNYCRAVARMKQLWDTSKCPIRF